MARAGALKGAIGSLTGGELDGGIAGKNLDL